MPPASLGISACGEFSTFNPPRAAVFLSLKRVATKASHAFKTYCICTVPYVTLNIALLSAAESVLRSKVYWSDISRMYWPPFIPVPGTLNQLKGSDSIIPTTQIFPTLLSLSQCPGEIIEHTFTSYSLYNAVFATVYFLRMQKHKQEAMLRSIRR